MQAAIKCPTDGTASSEKVTFHTRVPVNARDWRYTPLPITLQNYSRVVESAILIIGVALGTVYSIPP